MSASFRQLVRHNRERNSRRAPWRLPAIAGCGVLACILGGHFATAASHALPATDYRQLQAARASADPRAQRAYAWQTLLSLVTREGATPASPAITRWHSEVATFDPSPSPGAAPFPGLPVTTRAGAAKGSAMLAGGPLMTFIHYNPAAHDHIRHHRLYRKETLDALLAAAAEAGETRSIPPLPREAAVAMTAWWPVASRQPTPLPVWDPERQARAEGANGYLSWPRVLALVAGPASAAATRPLVFAGRTHQGAGSARLEQFFHRPVDASMAAQLMANARFRNAAMIVLGRPLAAGDFLALVGLHLMTAELDTGVWATYWWHDRPDSGPFASGRPAQLPPPWNHYLMDVTLDAQRPLEADDSPNICFNPWFDATFPDTGEGSGVQANCLSCHQRAAYPVTRTMRVTRGTPDTTASTGQLATALLWSIAKTGRIQSSEKGE